MFFTTRYVEKGDKMFNEINILRTMPIFKNIEIGKLEKIFNLLHLVKVKKGDVLIKEDDIARNFYILLSGQYKITFKNGKHITLDKKGEFLGWATIIAAPKYLGTGVALTDGDAFKLTRQDFMDLLISDAEIGNQIMANGSELAAKHL